MYLLLIWIVATILAGIIAYKIQEDGSDVAGTVVVSVIIYLIVVVILRINYATENNLNSTEYKSILIASLTQDEKFKLNGSFFLGCGSINGSVDDYYITYGKYKTDGNNNEVSLKRIKLDAYNTYLNRSDSEVPKIKNYYKRDVQKAFKSRWFWNRKETIGYWEKNYNELYLIVPTNTIKIEGKFNIDH
jgi:hypothetical protein